jgi:VanZ family protein
LATVAWALAHGVRAALPFVLVAPAAFGVRMLRVDGRLDGMLCSMLLIAQLGAAAGLTDRTGWWDTTAHGVTAALLTTVLVGVPPVDSLAHAIAAVLLLALLWEAAEWASDTILHTQFAPSVTDTVSDLAFDIAGAVTGAAVIAVVLRRRRTARRVA